MAASASDTARKGSAIVLRNRSPKTAIQVSLQSLFDGEAEAAADIHPGATATVPAHTGAAILTVSVGGTVVWSGAVPANTAAPLSVFPDQRPAAVAHGGRPFPQSAVLEEFRNMALDGMSTGVSASVQLGIVVSVVIVLVIACFVCQRLKIVGR